MTTPTRAFVVKQSRPQLRTREAWFSDIGRVFREVEVMRRLGPLLPPGTVPAVLFVDRDNYLFGMEHAPPAAAVWKERLLAGALDPAVARQAGTVLGLIHQCSAEHPEWADDLGERTVYVQLRINPFYVTVRDRRPEVAAAVAPLIAELLAAREAICHGDYTPKNILVHPPPAAGAFTLVDYETAHYGDPAMDLGLFLAHLTLKAVRDFPRRADFYALTETFWQAYGAVVRFRPLAALTARGVQHFAVCCLARLDGTSPVDYLPEEPKRAAVRRFCRRILWDRPATWAETLRLVEESVAALGE